MEYFYTWWTWYPGDTTGVILVAPLLLTLSHKPDALARDGLRTGFPRWRDLLHDAIRPRVVAEAIALAVISLAFAIAVFTVDWGIHVIQLSMIFVAPY